MGLEIAHQLDVLTLGCNLSSPLQHTDQDCVKCTPVTFSVFHCSSVLICQSEGVTNAIACRINNST